jgi:hypothetical protein
MTGVDSEFRAPHNYRLKAPQELHQLDVALPVLFGGRTTHFARCESLSLHFQVNFSVGIRRIKRDVTQPGTNGVDIDPGTKEMGRSRVPPISLET